MRKVGKGDERIHERTRKAVEFVYDDDFKRFAFAAPRVAEQVLKFGAQGGGSRNARVNVFADDGPTFARAEIAHEADLGVNAVSFVGLFLGGHAGIYGDARRHGSMGFLWCFGGARAIEDGDNGGQERVEFGVNARRVLPGGGADRNARNAWTLPRRFHAR